MTVLLTTQYLEEADQLADSVALLDQGRIVAQGTADELKASLGAEVLRLSSPIGATTARCRLTAAPTTAARRGRHHGAAADVHELPAPSRGAPARVSIHRRASTTSSCP